MRQYLVSILNRTGVAAGAAVIVGGSIAMLAQAETKKINFAPPLSWFDTGIWSTGIVPVDGESVDLEITNVDYTWDIDNGGVGVQLPNSTIDIGRGRYLDGSASGDPLLADDALVGNIIRFNGSGGQAPNIDVPVTVNEATSNRHGAKFNAPTTIGTINSQGSHQQKWEFNVSPTAAITSIRMADTDSRGSNHDDFFNANADMETQAFDLEWGRIRVAVGFVFDVGDLQITDDVDWTVKNEITLNGDMTADSLTFEDIAVDESVTLNPQPAGTYGSIGSPATVDNNVSWIIGDGVLTILP